MDITLAGKIDGIEAAAYINKFRHTIVYLTANTILISSRGPRKRPHHTAVCEAGEGIDLHWTINTALKRHNFEKSE